MNPNHTEAQVQPQLTGFDLLHFVSANLAHIGPDPENPGQFLFHVEESLAEALTQNTGFEVTTENLTNIYVEFAKMLGGIRLTISENTEKD